MRLIGASRRGDVFDAVLRLCDALPSSTFRRIAELLLVRDTTLIPNILWFEYTTQRTEARSRQRKQRNKAH